MSAILDHNVENFATLKQICAGYYGTPLDGPCFGLWANAVMNRLKSDQEPAALNRLSIDIPPDEMRQIFDRYGVIALRRLGAHSHFLGRKKFTTETQRTKR
jgi:hypothetical protein